MINTQAMHGKVYTITGAAGGIGLAVATSLASQGATLALADIKVEELKKAQQLLTEAQPNSTVTISVVDIRRRDQVDAWISATKDTFGKIDGCVNNAG